MGEYNKLENMFDRKIFEILTKCKVDLSNATVQYLVLLTKEEQKKLQELVLYYGDEQRINTYGIVKIQSEAYKLINLAESWIKKRKEKPDTRVPSILNILNENLKEIEIDLSENNSTINLTEYFDEKIKNKLSINNLIITQSMIDYLLQKNKLDKFVENINNFCSQKTNIALIGYFKSIEQELKDYFSKVNSENISNYESFEKKEEIETTEIQNYKSHLNPVRHKQQDLFILDNFDSVSLRDDMASMEHPLFALKAGDTKPFIYDRKNVYIDIRGSQDLGRATIFDKDVWIYAISKMIQAAYEGQELPRTVQFTTYDYLKLTNRHTSGREYINFKNSLNRLSGTRVYTNIKTGDIVNEKNWGLLEDWNIIKEDSTGKILHIEVTLPKWLYYSISSESILKIHEDYFRLRKPIDRRIYEITRKFCGNQKYWKIKLENLHKKTGSTSSLKLFRQSIKSLAHTNELPDYLIEYDRASDMVIFLLRDCKSQQEYEKSKKNIKAKNKRERVEKGISKEFLQKIQEVTSYHPMFSKTGITKEDFLLQCLKEKAEEDIILVIEKIKQAKTNLETMTNPKAYFLKVLKNT